MYDLRTNPLRLVHAECFGRSAGIKALVEVVHRQDEISVDKLGFLFDA